MLFTIGHSNHSLETFINMLKEQKVDIIADVRSKPASRYLPHFNEKRLQKALKQQEVNYVWLRGLGGMPANRQLYDVHGHADYRAISQEWFFVESLELLKREIKKHSIAIMCSEENPNKCHRRLLIVKTLCKQDSTYTDEVVHIRKGGKLENERDLQAKEGSQPSLWEEVQETQWRSPKPILTKL